MVVKNFLFHRVSPNPDGLWPPMHPVLFEKTIQFLSSNFPVMLLEDFLEDPGSYKKEKTLATISFDDGYKDNIEIAAPILQRYRCPASFYLVTDCIDHNLPTWTYITDHFFQQDGKIDMQFEYDFVPADFRSISWMNAAEGSEWGKKIKPWMKTLSNPQRLQIMEAMESRRNGKGIPRDMMMNWTDVKQLQAAGFYMGSHSRTHPMLASLTNETEIRDELENSAKRMETELGERPLTISYPIGSWDERVTRIAGSTGYKYGLAVEQRFYKPGIDNIFTIPRVELYNEPWWKARLRISGLYQVVKKLVK